MEEIERFLRLPEVKSLTGLGRSTIYVLMADGEFPRSIAISRRARAWKLSDVSAWQLSRVEGADHAA